VEQLRFEINKVVLFGGLFGIFFVGLVYLKFDFQTFFVKSLGERFLYLKFSERIISENPIMGVGAGQFIFELKRSLPNLVIWQYQPVHNIFLLIWSELGVVGLVLFIMLLGKLFFLLKSKP
jgi:O-antigen ligase